MTNANNTATAKTINAVDTINARLTQVSGVLSTLMASYSDEGDEFKVTPETILTTLHAAQALIDQAGEAARKLPI